MNFVHALLFHTAMDSAADASIENNTKSAYPGEKKKKSGEKNSGIGSSTKTKLRFFKTEPKTEVSSSSVKTKVSFFFFDRLHAPYLKQEYIRP